MNLMEAKVRTKQNIAAGNATLMLGDSGVGKTTIALEIAQEFVDASPKGEVGVGINYLATMSPLDWLGMPSKATARFHDFNGVEHEFPMTEPTIPIWCQSTPGICGQTESKPAACFKKFVLIMDEFGQGAPEVKRGAPEVLLHGGHGKHKLPEGSPVIALSNEGSRYGVSKDFDINRSRRNELHVQPDMRLYLNHIEKPYVHHGKTWQTMPIMVHFARQSGLPVIFEPMPEEQRPWCNGRQFLATDRLLQEAKAANNDVIPDDQSIQEIVAGGIGMPATQKLFPHFKFMLQLPSYEDVVMKPDETPVPEKIDMKMLMAYQLASLTAYDDLGAVFQYMERLCLHGKIKANDLIITFVRALMRRDWKTFDNHPDMKAWRHKNAALVAIISAS